MIMKMFVVAPVKVAGKIVTNPSGTRSLKFILNHVRHYGGKVYSNQVEVWVYGKDIDALLPKMTVGAMVAADGEPSAAKNEYQGKTYYNLKLVGNASVIGEVTGAPPAQPTTTAAAEPEESQEKSNVPF